MFFYDYNKNAFDEEYTIYLECLESPVLFIGSVEQGMQDVIKKGGVVGQVNVILGEEYLVCGGELLFSSFFDMFTQETPASNGIIAGSKG